MSCLPASRPMSARVDRCVDVEIGKGTVASISGNERRGRDRRRSIRMAELAETGEVVDAQVVDANRGGLVVDVGLRRLWVARVRRQAAAAQVIEADQGRHRPIRPRRRPRKSGDVAGRRRHHIGWQRRAARGHCRERDPVRALRRRRRVQRPRHCSEITWERGIGPTSLYQPGDSVRVPVKPVDAERGRISFFRSSVRGRTRGRAPLGRLASAKVLHPGDVVRVRVVAIEPARRGLSLSMRQAAGNLVYEPGTGNDANV